MLNSLFKSVCLLVFALGVADALGWLPVSWSSALPMSLAHFAAALLAIHLLELAVFWRHVRRYRGPLAVSVVLMLLFGMMHWKPLADSAMLGSGRAGKA